jgi:putative membrane protein
MIKTETQGFLALAKIALPYFVVSATYAILVLFLEEKYGDHIFIKTPQIGSVFGLAVAFFLGFRMNSAYDRWWEARKVFGELTNNTRSFSMKIFIYFQTPSNIVTNEILNKSMIAKELIDLICCYVSQLRSEIHEVPHPIYNDKILFLFEKYDVVTTNKVSNEILLSISAKIEAVFAKSANIEKSDLMQHLNRFYDIQGKAERINNTPFLKIYSAFTRLTVITYVLIIPFIVGDIDIGGEESLLELITIPILALVSTLFLTINKLANLYGDPLEENKTSVPIYQICKTIISNCQEVKRKMIR